jgi:FAD/FMN-containing dehydrogenase
LWLKLQDSTQFNFLFESIIDLPTLHVVEILALPSYTLHISTRYWISIPNQVAIVEPNVPLDLLVSESLKQGLMPLVVMEVPGITVGNGFSGASSENTGWKEGLFDCSLDEVEMVLGNGEVVRAS